LLDGEELFDYGTDPLDDDTDGDGILDGPDGLDDADGDGLIAALDADETDGPDADRDGDGLTNSEEANLGTDPGNSDTDGDGLSDESEVNQHGTDPLSADTDDDGHSDFSELNLGTDPLDPNDPDAPTCTCAQQGKDARQTATLFLLLLAGLLRRRSTRS